jgi:hypothetical protein
VKLEGGNQKVIDERNNKQGYLVPEFLEPHLAVIGNKKEKQHRHKTGAHIHDLDADHSALKGPAGHLDKITQVIAEQAYKTVDKIKTLFAAAAFKG